MLNSEAKYFSKCFNTSKFKINPVNVQVDPCLGLTSPANGLNPADLLLNKFKNMNLNLALNTIICPTQGQISVQPFPSLHFIFLRWTGNFRQFQKFSILLQLGIDRIHFFEKTTVSFQKRRRKNEKGNGRFKKLSFLKRSF